MSVSCSIPNLDEALACDVRPRRHPQLEHAERHTRAWAVAHGLIPARGPRHEGFCRARFGELAARAYPDVSRAQLALIADWITFLFAYDDLCDTQEAAASGYGAELERIEARLLALLAGAEISTGSSPSRKRAMSRSWIIMSRNSPPDCSI